jgi:DNA 3'-phosphatase
MFDLDGTIIDHKTKKELPGREKFLDLLNKSKSNTNIFVVLITNQTSETSRQKIVKVFEYYKSINPNLEMFLASKYDIFRKPSIGNFLEIHKIAKTRLNQDWVEGFYVGDAAGRRGDFSDSDIIFARNINLYLEYIGYEHRVEFYTPEGYFGDQIPHPIPTRDIELPTQVSLPNIGMSNNIVIIGLPNSGKSMLKKQLCRLGYTNSRKGPYSNKMFYSGNNLKISQRSKIIANMNQTDITYIYCNTPYQVCMKREREKELRNYLLNKEYIQKKRLMEFIYKKLLKDMELPENYIEYIPNFERDIIFEMS